MPGHETGTLAFDSPPAAATEPDSARAGAPMDTLAQESLALNLEASLRVQSEPHFFSWTQGMLQNLIRHDVLICALRKGTSEFSQVEAFSTSGGEAKTFAQLYRQDTAFAESLVRRWEENRFQPVVHDFSVTQDSAVASDGDGAGGTDGGGGCGLTRELARVGADRIVAHGTHDAHARMASFFLFACRAADGDPGLATRVEMLSPFLHAAWMRTKIGVPGGAGGDRPADADSKDLLTPRELVVLQWVYLGKSNIEIGLILGISPLTVKNHVQEILRRLNVQNRTQAVGKAFNLQILKC